MRDTIEMAREAQMPYFWQSGEIAHLEQLKRFEALIRADEREALQAEVLEQCRINGMSAEREDALRAELTRLKASIALDKMTENARELGLDYEPAPVQEKNQSPYPEYDRGFSNGWDRGFAAAQPAPWVGLSEEEVEAYDDWADFQVGCGRQTLFDMVRNIEAKLKEKNT
jgi:hypothetical protein